jgi:hypothetical protein
LYGLYMFIYAGSGHLNLYELCMNLYGLVWVLSYMKCV